MNKIYKKPVTEIVDLEMSVTLALSFEIGNEEDGKAETEKIDREWGNLWK